MTRNTDNSLITAVLRQLDRGGATELSDAERERAEMAFSRIVSTPHGDPIPVEPVMSHRRRGRLLVSLGLAGAVGVAVPVLLLGGGGAYATWTPTPTPLTGQAAAEAAETCKKSHQARPLGAPVDVPTMAAGGHLAMAERRGEWTYVLIEGPGRQEGVCLMRNDEIGKPGAEVGGHFTTDAAQPPTVAPNRIAVNVAGEGQTEDGWFNSVEGFVGSDVTGVTVHTSSGFDIQASVVGNRFAAWWPGRVQSSSNPHGETWSYTVHLADGSSRNAECSIDTVVVC